MVEDGGKKEEEKVEFDSAGQAFGYISLDQVAIEHARENTDLYGRRYAEGEVVWEVVSQEESEDYTTTTSPTAPDNAYSGGPAWVKVVIARY